MSRVPKTRTRLRKQWAPKPEAVFQAAPGTRLLAGWLTATLAVLFLIHQTQIEGEAIPLRLFALLCAAFFGALAWYFIKRGSRKGPVLKVGPNGFGIAVGFDAWIEAPWDDVEAFRYWEPTGIAMLIKRRQSRWVGILLNRGLSARNLPLDVRFEIWLNTFHNRPGLCILHPFVEENILDVLQAFKDHAPKRTDDYEWMKR
ncbi:MAG: hypothetical protein AAF439_04210 [Pseudomonadota bacterium]